MKGICIKQIDNLAPFRAFFTFVCDAIIQLLSRAAANKKKMLHVMPVKTHNCSAKLAQDGHITRHQPITITQYLITQENTQGTMNYVHCRLPR